MFKVSKSLSLAILFTSLLPQVVAAQAAPTISLVTKTATGEASDGSSFISYVSANGKYLIFDSNSTNLTSISNPSSIDQVYVYSVNSGELKMVSSKNGVAGNANSFQSDISASGRLLAYGSNASNLVDGDVNSARDVFVYNRRRGESSIVSRARNGELGNAASTGAVFSPDEKSILFQSQATNLIRASVNGESQIYERRLRGRSNQLITKRRDGTLGDGRSELNREGITAAANKLLVASYARNLSVPNSINPAHRTLYLLNRDTRKFKIISKDSSGNEAIGDNTSPSISANGRWVVFSSNASLVPEDTNLFFDVYLLDLKRNSIALITKNSSGVAGDNHSISYAMTPNARCIMFSSAATNLDSLGSSASNFHVYRYDRKRNNLERVSLSKTGGQENGGSRRGSMSSDGKIITFTSTSTDLVDAPDTNGVEDVFVATMETSCN